MAQFNLIPQFCQKTCGPDSARLPCAAIGRGHWPRIRTLDRHTAVALRGSPARPFGRASGRWTAIRTLQGQGHMETSRPDARPLAARKNAKKKIPAPRERCRDWKWRLAARYFPALLGAVSSPRGPLTAVFGMGTGVSAPPEPPTKDCGKADVEDESTAWRLPSPRRLNRCGEEGGQATRPIRTLRLNASPRLRLAPVDPVVFRGPSEACAWDDNSAGRLGA